MGAVREYEASLRDARRQSLQYRGAEHVRHAALDKAAALEKLAEQSSFIDDRAAGFEAKKTYEKAVNEATREDLKLRATEAQVHREKEHEAQIQAKMEHQEAEELSAEDRAAVREYEASLRDARRRSLQYRGAEHVRHAALDKAAAVEKLAEQSSFIDDRAAGFEAKKTYEKAVNEATHEDLKLRATEAQVHR